MFTVNNKNKNDRKILMESHCCFQYQIQSNPVLIIKYYLIWVLRLVCCFWRAGREDRCGVKNKCWENSEYLCLHYYVLFTLFWQFMTLHLLQTVPTFMMTVKKKLQHLPIKYSQWLFQSFEFHISQVSWCKVLKWKRKRMA